LKAGVDQKTIDIVRRNGALTGVDEKDAAVRVSGFYAIAVDEHMPPGRPDLESAPRQ
jgi:hypothetical protein